MYSESLMSPRSGFAGAWTFNPARRSRSATPAQLPASAKAPWTRTTVGDPAMASVMFHPSFDSRTMRSTSGQHASRFGESGKDPSLGAVPSPDVAAVRARDYRWRVRVTRDGTGGRCLRSLGYGAMSELHDRRPSDDARPHRTARAGQSTSPPFIGRQAELAAMNELVELVGRGLGGSVVFLGEPGVGKTRLVEQVERMADGSGEGQARVVRLVGIESELRLGFAAAHRLLRPFSDHLPDLPMPQRDALLTTFGERDAAPAPRFLIGLGALSLLAEAARATRFVFVIDDAQWIDRESLDLFGFIARRVHADGFGFVFAGRENSPNLQSLRGLPTHHLVGLDRTDSYSFLSNAQPNGLSSLVAARLVSETGGNPLAMLELVGQLSTAQLAGRLPLPQQLPTGRGLNAHFLRHVEMLPAPTRSLLVLASAMSDDDPSVLWRSAELLGLSPDSADAARKADILNVAEGVAFRHPLIRSAVYHAAEPEQRRAAHAALSAVAEQDGDPDLAAWHRGAAITTPDEDVAAGLERSAGRAERRGGQVAQARFLSRAAELSPADRDRSLRLFGAAQAYLASGDGILAEALLDKAAPWLDADGRHVDVQRMRASIAVFFSRHREAPAILLEAVNGIDPAERALIRDILFDALQAALVARRFTVGVTPTDIARVAVSVPRTGDGAPTARDLLLDGFATRLAQGYAQAVPLLRDAVAGLFADGRIDSSGLPSTILGWFAADDIWDDRGRSAMFERAALVERRHGTLGALRVALAGMCVGQAWTGDMAGAEQSYFEAAEISALIGIPAAATTGVILEVRAWQGREQESRATADLTAQWGRDQGAEILEVFSWFGLTVLEMGLGNYANASAHAVKIFERDPPGFGNRVLPELIEACARTGQREIAEAALARITNERRRPGHRGRWECSLGHGR